MKLQAVKDPATNQNFHEIERFASDLQRTVFRKVSELPESGVEGEVVYLESSNTLHFYNGTEWKAL